MRWIWIDRFTEFTSRQSATAIKNVSLAEEHLHDLYPAFPVVPHSLIVEGMAQTAGILVGHAEEFREKVILAKVQVAELDREATPGTTLRYTATMRHFDRMGASTEGVVELWDFARAAAWERIGRIDLMFSHIDQNMAGLEFPEENFVFGESFKTLLRTSGIGVQGG